MMQDAENQTDKQTLLLLLAHICSYCDQGIVDYITYIFTATLRGKYYLLLDAILQVKTLRFVQVK